MKLFLMTLLLSSAPLSASRSQYSRIADEINRSSTGWTAALAPNIPYDDDNALRGWLGAISISDSQAHSELASIASYETARGRSGRKLQVAPISAYPASLDLRQKYPLCSSIRTIRNQGSCGSCWAFATMNSLTDRWCISKTVGAVPNNWYFSVEDVLECCSDCNGGSGNGCNGGMPSYALRYARDVGVPSGDMKILSGGFCKPYFLDGVKVSGSQAPSCSTSCSNTLYTAAYTLDRTRITGYSLGKGENQMIAALNNGGTIAVAFTVYQDFYAYRSGVYKYTSGAVLGGHAVRLIGYGVDNGVNYWLVANSWGKYWGEAGFFRIRRGTNECNIESNYAVYGQI